MNGNAQPDIQLQILGEGQLMQAFGPAMSGFTFKIPSHIPEGVSYIAATVNGELAGLAKIFSADTNEVLNYIEVRDEFRNRGCGRTLKEAVFRFAAEHTGILLMTPQTDMGKQYLERYTDQLAKKFPTLCLAYGQDC